MLISYIFSETILIGIKLFLKYLNKIYRNDLFNKKLTHSLILLLLIHIYFLGSRWKCEVSDPTSKLSMNGDSLKSFSARQTASFEVTAVGCKKDEIKVNIIGMCDNISV